MNTDTIITLYEEICENHTKFLGDDVSLPKLFKNDKKNQFNKRALVLVYLYSKIGIAVSKEELTIFIRKFYPKTNDVQDGRHLSRQSGWNILSGGRNDDNDLSLKKDEYSLISIKTPYPGNVSKHRKVGFKDKDFNKLKEKYNYGCATCGSKEGKHNLLNSSVITKLTKGHMDPEKELIPGNIIPQCDECNRAYQDKFVFNNSGRVISQTKDRKMLNVLNENISDKDKIIKMRNLLS